MLITCTVFVKLWTYQLIAGKVSQKKKAQIREFFLISSQLLI
jgi:hypothetical protein